MRSLRDGRISRLRVAARSVCLCSIVACSSAPAGQEVAQTGGTCTVFQRTDLGVASDRRRMPELGQHRQQGAAAPIISEPGATRR